MTEKIKIAIQKSGRLSEDSVKLLKETGINFSNGTGKLCSIASNFPIEILFLRDDDIPQYVSDGVADIGIVGENVFIEQNYNAKIINKLGFSKCRLALALPKSVRDISISQLNGKSIATSYPNILKNFLIANNISADIHVISGSVEIAPSIGLADAICDIVSSGSTLIMNGLKELITVMESEAILIKNNTLLKEKEDIINQLLFRINSVKEAKSNKYILLNAPNEKLDEIIKILPGMKSPTVLPLNISGWSSLHSVIKEDDFWNIIEKLKALDAQGILVVPIEKMIL